MKEHPILFNSEMVREILGGRKTMTRRLVKPQPWITKGAKGDYLTWGRTKDGEVGLYLSLCDMFPYILKCPYGVPGDRLWVREPMFVDSNLDLRYKADGMDVGRGDEEWPYRDPEYVGGIPSMHMPRWASRITLEITNVRVDRVQEISRKDAMAEGLMMKRDFICTWDSLYPGSWKRNDWVWVIEFKKI